MKSNSSPPGATRAIAGISSMATSSLLAELAADYERASGRRVLVESVGGVDAARRVEKGEAFDFVVLAASAMDKLGAASRIVAETRVDVARSGIAVAVRAGAQRPELGDEDAVREAVLAARNIGYSTGPSGRYLARLLERWNIAAAMAGRMVEAPPGVPVAALIARGDVEMGFQQLSELINVPGVDLAGLLPREIQEITVFTGAVCTASSQPPAAAELLAFFAAPGAGDAKRRHGMEP